MRARRAVALGVVAWVVVAVAGATLVWGVISRAGEGVSGEVDAAPATDSPGSAGSPLGRRTLSPSPSPQTPPESAAPSTTTPSSATTPPETSAAPASVTRTWHGVAGLVAATCEGPVIGDASSSASSGYQVEVDDNGPDRVRVEFENDESRTRVEASCVDGVPNFTVEADD